MFRYRPTNRYYFKTSVHACILKRSFVVLNVITRTSFIYSLESCYYTHGFMKCDLNNSNNEQIIFKIQRKSNPIKKHENENIKKIHTHTYCQAKVIFQTNFYINLLCNQQHNILLGLRKWVTRTPNMALIQLESWSCRRQRISITEFMATGISWGTFGNHDRSQTSGLEVSKQTRMLNISISKYFPINTMVF